MKICIDCFADIELKSIIRAINQKDDCNMCEAKGNYVYNTDKHTELKAAFNSLIERYTEKSKLGRDFPSKLTVSLKSELKNNWNIFNKLEESQIYDILTEICSEKYKDSPEVFDGLVGISELGNDRYLKENTLFYSETWEDFSEEIKYKTRFHSEKFNTDIFRAYLSLLAISVSKDTLFYRGRHSNREGHGIGKMRSVPREKSQAGRANPKGIPYLYLANDIETVIYELRAVKMNYLTIVEFTLSKQGKIIDLTKIDQISPFIFQSEEMLTLHIVNKKYLEEIHNEIIKPTSDDDTYLDYLPTQYIFDFIRKNKTLLLDDGDNTNAKQYEIIGVKYKSSLNPTGINYVFFEDRIFDAKNAMVYKISDVEYKRARIK